MFVIRYLFQFVVRWISFFFSLPYHCFQFCASQTMKMFYFCTGFLFTVIPSILRGKNYLILQYLNFFKKKGISRKFFKGLHIERERPLLVNILVELLRSLFRNNLNNLNLIKEGLGEKNLCFFCF